MKSIVRCLLLMAVSWVSCENGHGQTLQILPASEAKGSIGGDLVVSAQSSDSSITRMDFFAEDPTGARRSLGFVISASTDGTLINGRGTLNWTANKSGLIALKASAVSGGKTITSDPFFVEIDSSNSIRLLTPKLNVTAGQGVVVAANFAASSMRDPLNRPRFYLRNPAGLQTGETSTVINSSGQASVTITPNFTGPAVAVVTGFSRGFTFTVTGDDPQPTTPEQPRLVNVSTLGSIVPNGLPLVGGFAVSGGPTRVLIRAVGPGLATLGVGGFLPNPKITLYRGADIIASNDDWGSEPVSAENIRRVSAAVGAFALPPGSLDAAMIVNLVPGAYTPQVSSSESGKSGTVIVEAYALPDL